MATTRSRPHGREHARPAAGGVAAEHATKIYAAAITGIVIIVAFLALTSIGHVIDAATQHFMLFYAGVFALIALCASTGLGLIATDRVFLNAGHRVLAQSAHRAASFGAVTFLIIHIVTEILAQRVHVLDAVVPFLSPFRTFYIGLGTIASDLIILLVITGIMRGRFNAHGRAWRWRAIHYTSYASFVFGVWHGLLAGRPAKPYVDWSYGLLVALVLLALAVRIVSNSLRPKENLSGPPVPMSGDSASAPMRAAAMFAQLGASRANTGGQPRLMVSSVQESVLSAPVSGGYPGAPMLTAPLPAGTGELAYEPGYEGPPRYLGAPRRADSGPMPRAATGPIRAATGPSAAAPARCRGRRPARMPRAADWLAAAPADRAVPASGDGSDAARRDGSDGRHGRHAVVAVGRSPVRADAARRDRPVPAAPSTGSDGRRGRYAVVAVGRSPVRADAARRDRPVPERAGRSGRRSAVMAFVPPRHRADAAGRRPTPPADSGPRPAPGPSPGRCRAGRTGSQPRTPSGQFPRAGTGPMPRAGSGPMRTAVRGLARPGARVPARCRVLPPARCPPRAGGSPGGPPVRPPARCRAPPRVRRPGRRPVPPLVRSRAPRPARCRRPAPATGRLLARIRAERADRSAPGRAARPQPRTPAGPRPGRVRCRGPGPGAGQPGSSRPQPRAADTDRPEAARRPRIAVRRLPVRRPITRAGA